MKDRTILSSLLVATLSLSLVSSCASESADASIPLVQHASLSGCGGFDRHDPTDPAEEPSSYCDSEVLQWDYDPLNETLEIVNRRILLNCCGDHHIGASLNDGILVVTETDTPDEQGARCGCMCTFDFSLTVGGVPDSPTLVQLVRHVTDDGAGEEVVWEGDLEFGPTSGEEIVNDSDAGMWCEIP